MNIVVASGKGGTGKTMVAANMAYAMSRLQDVSLVDCDVEEPNLHLYFPGSMSSVPVDTLIPSIDLKICDYCGKCGEFCNYGALTVLKNTVMFFREMCHSCGGCRIACPKNAISEVNYAIGSVEIRKPSSRLTIYSGVMNPGEVLAPNIIRRAKELGKSGLMICDAAPGISCPVIETCSDADFVLLVTEPTPFGLSDLKQIVGLIRLLNLPAGVVINRSFGNDEIIQEFCQKEQLPIFMTIPFSREFAAVQNAGSLVSREDQDWEEKFLGLYRRIVLEAEAR